MHNKLMDMLKRYLLVGGLPDAVNSFLNDSNIVKVRDIQQEIHSYYAMDASKYDTENRLKIRRIYEMLPSNLENKKKRVVVKDIENKKGKRFSDYQDEFDYLISAGIALDVKAISQPTFPLIESSGKNLLKLYLNDVGILTGILYRNNVTAILDDVRSINLGTVYESVVAQELKAHGFPLYYYDNKAHGEVDFLVDDFDTLSVVPLEVKSGKNYSEHSALLQCLNGENPKTIQSLIITCSGGALRDRTKEELKYVTVADALGHKTWNMGQKITIDSATLMNKGFEVIEAKWLYGIAPDHLRVVIHPESLIHSMIEYADGSIIAQISEPDMRLPIQYALSYPERWERAVKPHLFDRPYTFATPDLKRFPCLGYAFDAMKHGGTMPAVMNAANDYMVAQFLAGACAYLDIPKTIRRVMQAHTVVHKPTLEDIEQAIAWATDAAQSVVQKKRVV